MDSAWGEYEEVGWPVKLGRLTMSGTDHNYSRGWLVKLFHVGYFVSRCD
jgi:hypothetical protein